MKTNLYNPQSHPIEKVSVGFGKFTLRYEGPDGYSKFNKMLLKLCKIGVGVYCGAYCGKKAISLLTWYIKNDISRKKGWIKGTIPPNDSNSSQIESLPLPSLASTETINDGIERAKANGSGINRVIGPIRPGEILVIAGCTGHGKSILATQLGLECAWSKPSKLFAEGDQNDYQQIRQSVVLYDAEQDDEDILDRYGNHDVHYPSTFERLPYSNFDSTSEVLEDIRGRVVNMFDSGKLNMLFILDNITSFFTSLSNEKVRQFYFGLKQLQKQIQLKGGVLTFIVLTHMTKIEDHISVEKKHVNGCANMTNFATRVWAIRPTILGKEYWMLKTLKQRRGVPSDSVSLLHLRSEPYLHFEFQKTCPETDLLPDGRNGKKEALGMDENPSIQNVYQKAMSEEQKQTMRQLKAEGHTQKEIGKILGFSRKTINKHLNSQQD